MLRLKVSFFSGVILILLMSWFLPTMAQDETILTLAVPEWMQFDVDDALEPFLEAHPGVKVVRVNITQNSYAEAAMDLDQHFEIAEAFVGQADVLLLQSSYVLTPATTRAGFFLDLSPLVMADPELDQADFFPAVWQAYQWDNGIWALPASASASLVMYNADAFDEVNLNYPNENWTLSDFAYAINELTQYNSDGEVIVPGMYPYQANLLLRALLGQPFYDASSGLVQPRFASPEVQALIEEWQQVSEDIFDKISYEQIDYNTIPIMVEQTYRLRNSNEDANWQAAPLPGGLAVLDVQAFAVSAGTPYPQLAYELAKYLTSSPEVSRMIYGDSPARRSMVDADTDEMMFFRPELPEEAQALIEEAMESGIGASGRLFEDYFNMAMNAVIDEGQDPLIALQEAEIQAQEDLEIASARAETGVISVATPVPTPVLSDNEIALTFSINANISPLPNRENWEQLALDFVAEDPEVRHIELLSNFSSQDQEDVDCYYSTFSSLSSMDLSEPPILNLDPLINADPNFDRADFVPHVLDQLTVSDRLWGLPLTIEPAILWYRPDLFEEANVPAPENGWTVSEFADALQMLYANSDEFAPFQPSYDMSSYLFMLMAAYGVVPYDYRTTPPTLNLTDPVAVETIRQVLDLAKNGYMDYYELAGTGGGGFSSNNQSPLIGDRLNLMSWRIQFLNTEGNQLEMTTFPVGTQYTPVSYQVGAGYINVDTAHPEGCYRWLSYISQHPEVFNTMPARLSQFDNPSVAARGEGVVAVYQSYAELFASPDLIVFDDFGSSNYDGGFVEQIWINEVFDAYVLEDADLESELANTEANIMVYRDCIEGLPGFDTLTDNRDEAIALMRDYAACAIGIDPAMQERFSYLDEIE
ncbi:extracellular solute-binding protein [Phototrophicus methaneseepsis]|uniref:Extracellular solute-binding protein n=1 Tax=Phototrophicus methaneseepsis TaxID=2710758 RepID=A0A7S8E533_9CHLR|nr:extracellular solute-binding protein [Phototrophicus methaneseepsis]QPC80516.1 extracellular solute-binding protein [Phototrophicus methaneseepsis]